MAKRTLSYHFTDVKFVFVHNDFTAKSARSYYHSYNVIADGRKIGEVHHYFNDWNYGFIDAMLDNEEDAAALHCFVLFGRPCPEAEYTLFHNGGTVRMDKRFFEAHKVIPVVEPVKIITPTKEWGRPAYCYKK